MNCKNCHAVIPDDSAFCPKCGNKIIPEKDTSAYFSMGGDINTPETSPVQKLSEPSEHKFCTFCGNVLPSDARFCSRCAREQSTGTPAPSMRPIKPKTHSSGLKRHLRWIIPVAVVLMLVIVYAGIRSAAPWYDLGSNGTFMVNERMWELFCNPFQRENVAMEIPRKYDGKIDNFSGKQLNFSYDGTLEQLITNHPWAFRLELSNVPGTTRVSAEIRCKDYTVRYGYYTDPLRDSSLGSADYAAWMPNRYLNTNCKIIRKDGKYLPFQSIADMKLWVLERTYHMAWSSNGLFGDWSIHDEYIDPEDVEFID